MMSHDFLPEKQRHKAWRGRARAPRRGQNIVEFALVVPILLTLLLGILEGAWLGRSQLAAANGAREGARLGALGQSADAVKARTQNTASSLNLTAAQVTLSYSGDGGSTYPNVVTGSNVVPAKVNGTNPLLRVSISRPHRALTGFFPFLRSYNNTAQVTMRREGS